MPKDEASSEIAGKKPTRLITDGADNFHRAYKTGIRSYFGDRKKTEHIREIALTGRVHNNKMERMNGEIRDREKDNEGFEDHRNIDLEGLPDIPQLH